MLLILSYILGGVGVCVNFAIYRQKNRKNLLGVKLISDIIWGLHYALISAWSGAATCAIGFFREIVFINKEHKWAQSKLWLIGFIMCNLISAVITQKGFVSILPAVASTVSIIVFWIGNPSLTRYIQIPISCGFLVYNSFSGSFMGIINEILSLTSIFTFFIKEKIAEK